MKKNEIFKNYKLTKVDDKTVFIQNNHFDFSYTIADGVVKDEFKGLYRSFGGLQTNYNRDSEEHKNIEKWLCELAEMVLNVKYEKAR